MCLRFLLVYFIYLTQEVVQRSKLLTVSESVSILPS